METDALGGGGGSGALGDRTCQILRQKTAEARHIQIVRQTQCRLDIVDCKTDTAEARHFRRTDMWKVVRPQHRRLDSRNGGTYTSEARHVKRPDMLRGQTLLIMRQTLPAVQLKVPDIGDCETMAGYRDILYTTFFIRNKVFTQQNLYKHHLYVTKFIRDKVYTVTKFIHNKIYTVTKFIQSLFIR